MGNGYYKLIDIEYMRNIAMTLTLENKNREIIYFIHMAIES